MNYSCYWINADGVKRWEGTFRVVEETKEKIKLYRTQASGLSIYPDKTELELPKEGYKSVDAFITNPQYWTDNIQVHLGNHGFAFIFEIIGKNYLIQLKDKEKQKWLEEFLDDNKIKYAKSNQSC